MKFGKTGGPGMAAKILVDSDLLIDAVRGFQPTILLLKELESSCDIYISVASAMELVTGAQDKKELVRITAFIGQFTTIQFSAEIGISALALLEEHYLRTNLNMADALIASTAITHKLSLYTRNKKHFSFINNL